MRKVKIFSCLIIGCLFSVHAFALEQKSFSWGENFPKGLDLTSYSSPQKLSALSQIKWYQNKEDWRKCLDRAESKLNDTSLGIWISYVHLSCLSGFITSVNGKGTAADSARALTAFKKLESHKKNLLTSPFSGHKDKLLRTFLDLGKMSVEKSRHLFDELIDRNIELVDYMNQDQRGIYYRMMGEMAWLRQKNEVAKSNFLRSYSFSPNPDVLKKLQTLQVDSILKLSKYAGDYVETEDEASLWAKFSDASKKGESLKLAQYGSEFLTKFPGSSRVSTVRDEINTVYKRLLYRKGQKYTSSKSDYENQLMKAPPQYVLFWAQEAYSRGYQDSSFMLAEKAVEKWEGYPQAADALILAGRSAYYLGKRSEAKTYFNTLIKGHSGSSASQEAQYLIGLLFYREGDYDKVVSVYDQFLRSSGSDKWELQVRYWLWRSLKKINSPRSTEIAETIFKSFPLTYYGLVVRMEEKKGLQNLLVKPVEGIQYSFWWTKKNQERWARVKKLVELGWLDEAESEIDFMPDPQLAAGYLVRSKIWDSARLYNRSIQDYASAIDIDQTLLSKNYMKLAFPDIHRTDVEKSEKEFVVNRNLIWSIMRQESSYMPRAMSPSNAFGLMQMLNPTARETAKLLKIKEVNLPQDLYDPKTSIRFGAHFISRMIKKYKNVVPFAIASYNVGPGNLDRWLSHRTDLEGWEKYGGNPDDDMWMDELPWAETSFYVKAVLRNYFLYKIIHENYDKMMFPFWTAPATAAATPAVPAEVKPAAPPMTPEKSI